ncbi:MAG: hypothetical protein AB7F36_17185 [Reyranellaceae bacterium]
MTAIGRLWRGQMPLANAFWDWAVIGGLLVNLGTSLGFYLLLTEDLTVPAMLVGYGLSLPYNFLVTVGVWRCASAHRGSRKVADLAKIVTLVGMIVLSAT